MSATWIRRETKGDPNNQIWECVFRNAPIAYMQIFPNGEICYWIQKNTLGTRAPKGYSQKDIMYMACSLGVSNYNLIEKKARNCMYKRHYTMAAILWRRIGEFNNADMCEALISMDRL